MGEPLHHPAGGHIAGDAGRAIAYLVMGLFAFMTIAPIIWLALSSDRHSPLEVSDVADNVVNDVSVDQLDQAPWLSLYLIRQ